jgi:hypothetical protein
MTISDFFQAGERITDSISVSTSSWPAIIGEGGWSSFEPGGPKRRKSTKFGSIQETAGSRPSRASSRNDLRSKSVLRAK